MAAELDECLDHRKLTLKIGTAPLEQSNIARYRPGELEAIGERLNRITDIWDFAAPGPVTGMTGVWIDYAHFKPAIGAMMIARMFGGDAAPDGFGQFRPKTVP